MLHKGSLKSTGNCELKVSYNLWVLNLKPNDTTQRLLHVSLIAFYIFLKGYFNV